MRGSKEILEDFTQQQIDVDFSGNLYQEFLFNNQNNKDEFPAARG